MALVLANGFLFAGFHFLLPTITLYAASLGATGGEIGSSAVSLVIRPSVSVCSLIRVSTI